MRHNRAEWFSRREVERKRIVQIHNDNGLVCKSNINRNGQRNRRHYRNAFNLKPPANYQASERKHVDSNINRTDTQNSYEYKLFHTRDPLVNQSSQPHWHGIKQPNFKEYSHNEYRKKESFLKCNQKIGHLHCNARASFHEQSVDNDLGIDIYRPTENSSGVKLQSTYFTLDQNNNHTYSNTSIKTETSSQIWHNDIQGGNLVNSRDIRTVTRRLPYTEEICVAPSLGTRERCLFNNDNQCFRDFAQNQHGFSMFDSLKMEGNSNKQFCNYNSDLCYIDNPMQDVDYRKVNMISADDGICPENQCLADTDMRMHREHKSFISVPEQSLCFRDIETPPFLDKPALQHEQMLALRTDPVPYFSAEPNAGDRCLPHTVTLSTLNEPTHTPHLGPSQEQFQEWFRQDPEFNDSLTTFSKPTHTPDLGPCQEQFQLWYQQDSEYNKLVESTYDFRESNNSSEQTSDFLQSKLSMPFQTFSEEQSRNSHVLQDNFPIECPWKQRIIRNMSSSTPLPICQVENFIGEQTLNKRKNADADKDELNFVLPPKRRKNELFRPWSSNSENTSFDENYRYLDESRENQKYPEEKSKASSSKLATAKEETGKTIVARATEEERNEGTMKPCISKAKETCQTENDSIKDSLYKVSHVNLNMKAIKRSLSVVSVTNSDIKTPSVILNSTEMPSIDVASSTLTKAANPSIKLQLSMNSGRKAVFKAWEDALVTKTIHQDSFKPQTIHSENKRVASDLNTGKVNQSTKSKIKKKIDLLKLVDKNIKSRNARYVLHRKTFIGQPIVNGEKLDTSHNTDEKSDVSNIHPKLRHKLSKTLATSDKDENVISKNKREENSYTGEILVEVMKNKDTEVADKRTRNEDRDLAGNQSCTTDMRSYRKGIADSYSKDIKDDTKLDKNNNCENQKTSHTYILSRNVKQMPSKGTRTFGKGQSIFSNLSTYNVKQSQKLEAASKPKDVPKEKQKSGMNSLLTAEGIIIPQTNIKAKTVNEKELKYDDIVQSVGKVSIAENCNLSSNVKERRTNNVVDTPPCVSDPKSPDNTCYAVQVLNGPIVSSTYYKKSDETNKKMKVIRHAREDLIGFSNSMDQVLSGNTHASCATLCNDKRDHKNSTKENNRSPSDLTNLMINISPSLSGSVNNSNNKVGNLNDSSNILEKGKKEKHYTSDCTVISDPQDYSGTKKPVNNNEHEVTVTLSSFYSDKEIQNKNHKDPSVMTPKGYPDAHTSLEMHMKYMKARSELETIDCPPPFLPPLPPFVPAPVVSPLYSKFESVLHTGFNGSSYSPTQEDFERYKYNQRQRLPHITSAPMSPPPVHYLYRDGMSTCSREVPSHYVGGQHEVNGLTLRPSNSTFQKSRNFVSMYDCDSTTQTYDDMINDVSSTVMFDTNIVQDLDQVIDEVVTKTCASPELESLVTDLSLLSEEKFDCTNMEESIGKKDEIPSCSGSNVEITNLNSSNSISFHYGVRPRYTKRFPSYYPKAKPERHNQEMELYKAANTFLGDFDRSNKRACRKQNAPENKYNLHHEKETKVEQVFESGVSRNNSKEMVAKRLETIAHQDGLDKAKNDEKIANTIEPENKAEDRSEKPEIIAKLKVSELLKKCKSRISFVGKKICKQGKMFTMRKQFDKNSRQQFLKSGDKVNYNKTPFIKVENMKSGEKSKASCVKHKDQLEESKPVLTCHTTIPDKLCHQKLDRAVNQQASKKRTCLKCNKNFDDSTQYYRHLKKNHDIPIFCGVCGLYFNYKDGYYRHLKSQIHCNNLEKFPSIPKKSSSEMPKAESNLNDSVISISSETSTDEVSVHYVSSCPEEVLTSPERKVVTKKKIVKLPQAQKEIKLPEVQKAVKSLQVQKGVKSLQIQKNTKSFTVQKPTKSIKVQKCTKSPQIQKCTKSLKIQKLKKSIKVPKHTKSSPVPKHTKSPQVQKTKILKHAPVQKQKLFFCDPCRKFYKMLSAHMKTEKHLKTVKLRKKEMRQKRMEEAKRQLCKETGKTKVIQVCKEKQKTTKGNGKTTKN